MLLFYTGMFLKDSGEGTSYQWAELQAMKLVVQLPGRRDRSVGRTLDHRQFRMVCLEGWELERNKIRGIMA